MCDNTARDGIGRRSHQTNRFTMCWLTWRASSAGPSPSDLIDVASDSSSAMRFSKQGGAAKKGMHAFFFYANCYHEVEELTSGARLVGPCKLKPVLNAPGISA